MNVLNLHTLSPNYTVNREYFVVKVFSYSLAYAKIKRVKIYVQY